MLIASARLPPFAGGAQQVAWELANALADKLDVHIITTQNSHPDTSKRITVHSVPRYPALTVTYSTIFRQTINKIIREVSPDIIHSHIALPWGYIFRSEKGTKRVVTLHGSDVYPKWSRLSYYRYFLIPTLKRSNALITPSNWLSKYVYENYQVQPTVIPNGVDTEAFRPIANSETYSNVILFVGRYLEKKGIFDLVEAARALPEYEFWFVGEGDVKLPSLTNIKDLGFVDNTLPIYTAASLCAFPSHYENFPIVGLEAMASGKAVIATERGFSEYIEHGQDGILVKPHDVQAMVDAIRYLMENKDIRRSLEQRARRKAIQYDWTMVAEKHRALYESLMR